MKNDAEFAISSRASTALRDMLAQCDVHEPVFSFCIVKPETDLSRSLARMYASGASVESLASVAKESITDDDALRGNLLVDVVSAKEIGDFPLVTIGGLRFVIGETRAFFRGASAVLDFDSGKFVFVSSEGTSVLPR